MSSASSAFEVCACRKLADHELCANGLDDDCNGKVDDCRICDGQPVADDDPNHCGGCGNVCEGGKLCVGGECRCAAPHPDECAGVCTDTQVDVSHCGGCDNACGDGQACRDGACVCTSAALPDLCPGAGCVNTQSDPAHCGSCDTACESGQTCQAGACVCTGMVAPDACPGAGCVDLQVDAAHCGSCDVACPATQACRAGACVCASTLASVFCAGSGCVNVFTNNQNCGRCGHACAAPTACLNGVCSCPSGQSVCGDSCVALSVDTLNCGTCGHQCGPGQGCQVGVCTCPNFDLVACGDACVNLRTDVANCGNCSRACVPGAECASGVCQCSGPICGGRCVGGQDPQNCGACGVACAAGQQCVAGTCYCPVGFTLCGGSCVDESSDAAHCGSCDNACATGLVCSSGVCSCPAGTAACGATGECVNIVSDPNSCGDCSHVCPPDQICDQGLCECPQSGQVFCMGLGHCVDAESDAANCGGCGLACAAGQVCLNGACVCPESGALFCASANACVDALSDPAHCGACDHACPAAAHCALGACECDAPEATLCGATCRDLWSDPQACGSCDHPCPGSANCEQGQCHCPAGAVGALVRLTNSGVDDVHPSAAWDGTHVGVAYAAAIDADYANLRFSLLNPDGSVASDVALTDYLPGSLTGLVAGPALVWSGSEYGLLWEEQTDLPRLVFQRLDAAGAALGSRLDVGDVAVAFDSVDTAPSLAWSSPYAEYAFVFVSGAETVYRTLGADGLSLGATIAVAHASTSSSPLPFAVAPNGNFGVAVPDPGSVKLDLYDSTGFVGAAATTLSSSLDASAPLALVHDGSVWLGAFSADAGSTVRFGWFGSQSDLVAETLPPGQVVADLKLVVTGGTAALAWVPATSGLGSLRLQRFTLPQTGSVVAFDDPVDILSTPNISTGSGVALVSTTPGKLLAVWSDAGGGVPRDLYAASVALDCP